MGRVRPGDYLPPVRGWPQDKLPPEIYDMSRTLTDAHEPQVITLPFPTSANRYWRHFRGHPVRSDEADQYKEKVALYCRAQGIEPIPRDVNLWLYFYRFNAARDLDNSQKVLLDALQGFAYINDNNISEIRAMRDYDSKAPRVHILVWGTIGRDEGKIKSRR